MGRRPTPICDPLTIAGIAATVGGVGANFAAQQQQEDARSGALAAERIRQQGFDQQTAALNTQSQDRYQNFQGQQDQRAKSLTEMFQAPAQLPPGADPMPASSSNLVVQAETDARGAARERTDQRAAALGNLRSFGDVLGQTSRLQGRDAGLVGQVGNFKKGSSNVLGLELDAANSAGGDMRMLGDVLGGLGRVGVAAGLSGPPASSANFVPNPGAPGAFGSGGYTGKGPFMNPGQAPGMFNLFGGR